MTKPTPKRVWPAITHPAQTIAAFYVTLTFYVTGV